MRPCGSGRWLSHSFPPITVQTLGGDVSGSRGGTIFPPLRSDPAVSPWAEMSQLYIVTACPWVGLQLS